jgi:hypothetical protein
MFNIDFSFRQFWHHQDFALAAQETQPRDWEFFSAVALAPRQSENFFYCGANL